MKIALGHGNLETVVRTAAGHDVALVAFPELCTTPYFCSAQDGQFEPVTGQTISRMSLLAKGLGVVIVVPFAESDGSGRYNSAAIIDADGTLAGVYRKRHVPPDEIDCFQPGDSRSMVFSTAAGRIGVAICWDRFFPDTWETLVREQARLAVVPTASSEHPVNPGAAHGVIAAIVNRSDAPFSGGAQVIGAPSTVVWSDRDLTIVEI